MSRFARIHVPGGLVHVIARLVNREYRIDSDAERDAYLRQLERGLDHGDARVLAFAVMSNHIHLVCQVGRAPITAVVAAAHTGFALWLNRAQGRIGPVFAERHTTVWFPPEGAAGLIAYVHNNPVRAGVVATATSSTWTSHGAYVGARPAPPWLDVALGLRLCGFEDHASGRRLFDLLVRERAGEPRRRAYSDDGEDERRGVRATLAAPMDVTSAMLTDEGRCFGIVARAPITLTPPVDIAVDAVVAAVARYSGLAVDDVLDRSSRRAHVEARRLAIAVWMSLGQPQRIMATRLGISSAASSKFATRPMKPETRREVQQLAERLREEADQAPRGEGPPKSRVILRRGLEG